MVTLSGDTNVRSLLIRNPRITDPDLAAVVRANMAMENQPKISVTTEENYQFASGIRKARVISITPYGNMMNFLVTLKRTLVGVTFESDTPTDKITSYVLGLLSFNDPSYQDAERQVTTALNQGQRFIVAISVDAQQLVKISMEENQDGSCIIL